MSDSKEIEVTIINPQGMHARPAAQFVRIASKYPKAELTVIKEELSVNGKSIIGIMTLQAGPGTRLLLKAEGEGAQDLLEEIDTLVKNQFGEGVAS